jgi:hypothetical protein
LAWVTLPCLDPPNRPNASRLKRFFRNKFGQAPSHPAQNRYRHSHAPRRGRIVIARAIRHDVTITPNLEGLEGQVFNCATEPIPPRAKRYGACRNHGERRLRRGRRRQVAPLDKPRAVYAIGRSALIMEPWFVFQVHVALECTTEGCRAGCSCRSASCMRILHGFKHLGRKRVR